MNQNNVHAPSHLRKFSSLYAAFSLDVVKISRLNTCLIPHPRTANLHKLKDDMGMALHRKDTQPVRDSPQYAPVNTYHDGSEYREAFIFRQYFSSPEGIPGFQNAMNRICLRPLQGRARDITFYFYKRLMPWASVVTSIGDCSLKCAVLTYSLLKIYHSPVSLRPNFQPLFPFRFSAAALPNTPAHT